jgi:hypothetical protein
MVTAQLQTNGFNVVEPADARFLLWCITEQKLLGRESGYQFPYTYVFLNAYVTAELKAGKEKTIWEGRVVEASGPFNKAPESFVKTLVQFVGKDFKGDTPVLP